MDTPFWQTSREPAPQRSGFRAAPESTQRPRYIPQPVQYALNLPTAVLAAHTPLSEVLAVVGEEAIAVFPESRHCAPNNLVPL
jgi:hypothetical protein